MNELFYLSVVEEIQKHVSELHKSLSLFNGYESKTIDSLFLDEIKSIKHKTELMSFHLEELEHKTSSLLDATRYQSAPSLYSSPQPASRYQSAQSLYGSPDSKFPDEEPEDSMYKAYSSDQSPTNLKNQDFDYSSCDEIEDEVKKKEEEIDVLPPRLNELSEWDKLFLQLRSDLMGKEHENKDEANDENFQEMLKGVYQLETNFFAAASTITQMIVAEQHCEEYEKKIRPVDVGGQAGGTKFSLHGLFFKYPVDSQLNKQGTLWLYGGKQRDNDSAVKASNNDMKGLTYCMINDEKQFLSFPLMALIDFQGFRMSVMTSLPLHKDSLVYGSADAGHTLKANSEVHSYMLEMAEKLNLRLHNIRGHNAEMALCGDVEIHQIDQQEKKLYYALDLARVFPPANLLLDSPSGSIFYRMLRPELTQKFERPLCSDALSGWLDDVNKEEMNYDIGKATDLLYDHIKQFAQEITQEINREKYIDAYYHIPQQPTFDGSPVKLPLIRDMQFKGINIRYLGKLLLEVTEIDQQHPLNNVIFTIMVTRCLKNLWRSKIRSAREKGKKNRIFDICQKFSLMCLNYCLSIHSANKLENPLYKEFFKKFQTMFSHGVLETLHQMKLQKVFDTTLPKVYKPAIIINFCQLNGIILNPRCVLYFSTPMDFKFTCSDIVGFVPVVKCSPILDIFSGLYLYFSASKEKYAISRLSLMKSAVSKLDSVVNTYFPNVRYYLSEAQFEILRLDKNSFGDWDNIINHFSTKWTESCSLLTTKCCWEYLLAIVWKILRGSDTLHSTITQPESVPLYYTTDSSDTPLDDLEIMITPRFTVSKDGDINYSEPPSSMVKLIDESILQELEEVKSRISKASCKILPDFKYLIGGPLKMNMFENELIMWLINEAKDWDIDIKQKCAFFMHYFNLTDLLLLCDYAHIVPKDKNGLFHLGYYPHVLALSDPDPVRCLELLLKLDVRDKSSINALMSPNCEGETVLTNAIKQSNVKLVECLVKTTKGVPIVVMTNREPLLVALQMLEEPECDYLEMIRIIQLLIASDFSFPSYDDLKNTLLNENLLHDITVDSIAKVKLQKEIEKFVPLILEDRANAIIDNCLKYNIFNINAKDDLGNAAIHRSAMNGDMDTLKLLVKSGCDINFMNNYGDTPLHIAVESDQIEIVKILLQRKECNLNLVNNLGFSALHNAAQYGKLEIVTLLLSSGCNKDITNENGDTPLHYAVDSDHTDIVQLLLEHKCSTSIVNRYGSTALHNAADKSAEQLNLFLKKGCDPNTKNSMGQSLLHSAIDNRKCDIIDALILAKCSLELPNQLGDTPLYCAIDIGDLQIIVSIKSRGFQKHQNKEW